VRVKRIVIREASVWPAEIQLDADWSVRPNARAAVIILGSFARWTTPVASNAMSKIHVIRGIKPVKQTFV